MAKPTPNAEWSAYARKLGTRLQRLRAERGLSQERLAYSAGITRYTISNLSPGTYYFSVRAYTSNGTESANSNVSSKVVR